MDEMIILYRMARCRLRLMQVDNQGVSMYVFGIWCPTLLKLAPIFPNRGAVGMD
jgi:hypothetical protein